MRRRNDCPVDNTPPLVVPPLPEAPLPVVDPPLPVFPLPVVDPPLPVVDPPLPVVDPPLPVFTNVAFGHGPSGGGGFITQFPAYVYIFVLSVELHQNRLNLNLLNYHKRIPTDPTCW